jgi:hypothetical protein
VTCPIRTKTNASRLTRNNFNLFLIVLFVANAVAFSLYLTGGLQGIYNPGDTNFPTNPYLDYPRSASLIDWKQSFGNLEPMSIAKHFPLGWILWALDLIGFSGYAINFLVITALIFFSQLGSYILVRQYATPLLSIGLALSYTYNPYVITLVLGGSNLMPMFMVAGLPFLCLAYQRLEDNNFKKSNIFLFIFGLILTKSSLTNPMFGLPFILFAFAYFVCRIRDVVFIKRTGLYILIGTFLYADIILALIIGFDVSRDALISSTRDLNIIYFVPGGASFVNTIAGLPHWGFFGEYSGELYYDYSEVFSNLPYVYIRAFLGVSLIGCMLYSLVTRVGTNKADVPIFIFFVVCLFFVVGSNSFFGGLFLKVLEFTNLSYALRESHDKLSAGIALSLMFFAARASAICGVRSSRISAAGGRVLALLWVSSCIAFPIAGIFYGDLSRNNGIMLGGTRVDIPYDIDEINRVVAEEKLGRLLILPPQDVSVPGISSFKTQSGFYTGPDILDRSVRAQFIYPTKMIYGSSLEGIHRQLFYDLVAPQPTLNLDLICGVGIDGILLNKKMVNITYRHTRPWTYYFDIIENVLSDRDFFKLAYDSSTAMILKLEKELCL